MPTILIIFLIAFAVGVVGGVFDMTIETFCQAIIEGPRGMNAYEEREVVAWQHSERVAAAIWTIKCLANPGCDGSHEALEAIIERREALRK